MLMAYLTRIADALRKALGTNDVINAQDFDKKITDIYDAGFDKMVDNFWNAITYGGTSTDYYRGGLGLCAKFVFWGEKIEPPFPIETKRVIYMFNEARNLPSIGEVVLPNCTDAGYFIYRCYDLENIDAIIVPNAKSVSNICTYANKLKRIGRIDISSRTDTGYVFYGCSELEEINFEGPINTSISFQWCTKLTHDSLMSIINALKDNSEDTSGTTYTLTLGATNIAKLTNDEILIAENKGWVIT